jgi:Porin subfamily
MKMVKSLLLGSAAGVVAVAGAQAADLPVKAKAVEYVKICSLYGAGFYFIPGTDICMKVGGYVRFQQNWANGGNNISNGPWQGSGGRNTRTDSADWMTRSRAVASFDTRQQTQYGVLRTYLVVGFSQDLPTIPGSNVIYANRGFIQIAGFTFGRATSYYDFVPRAALAYHAGSFMMPDTGEGGQIVAAYTAQFGGGVSASIAAEQSLRSNTVWTSAAAFATLGAAPLANNLGTGGTTSATGNPDIVANLRFDGAWGGFQVAGVLHDASAGYYGTLESLGHPGNKWGWGVSPAVKLNVPMLGTGDALYVGYSYTEGAIVRALGANSVTPLIWNGGKVGFGFATDGVYSGTAATATGIELTTAWSLYGAYEHFWTPALQTSLYGSYAKVSHNATATAAICANASLVAAGAVAGQCNPDWSAYTIGSRTQWNVVRGLYMGVDVIYMKLKTAQLNSAGTIIAPASGAKTAGLNSVADQSAWAFTFRVHRDVVP